ncbi:restriction endonuclease subunit S [Bifidobacterium felsineum]|uniref:restriction endonuclease subunit S n=1 Tax=Bifidobacterium felsineum TaxID=2045440 RepID=UPI001BDC81AE|nr:restriction endonuclease subunit S [Bifidobacterium felsineum]MBT1163894.1 restriction endonuclease subunit S [Bifidobacterium felsineum]
MTESSNKPSIRFAGFTDPWEQRKLGELADIVGGGTPDTNNADYWDGDIDWYSPAELGDQIYADGSVRRITEAGFSNCSARMLPAGQTILFTSRAGIGNTAILRHAACTNQGFQSLVIGMHADVYFVYSMSNRIKKWAEEKASGSTFLEISGKQLASMPISMPSLIEQQAIGSFFSRLDSLITLHQRKYDKLVVLKKSMLEQMFPQEGESVPKIRFAGFTDPWEQRKLGEIAVRITDMSSDSDLPRVEYEDISANVGILNKNVNHLGHNKSGIAFKPDDILYGKLRPYLHNWLFADFAGVAVGDFWVLRSTGIDPTFLYRIICGKRFDSLANVSAGSKMPRADWSFVGNSEYAVPKQIKEQQTIGSFFSRLDSLITLHQRKLELLKNIKKSLLEQMFV